MKIAIIGSGNVGAALAGGWVKAGHEVCFGSRDPKSEKITALLQKLGSHACVDGPQAAAAWGEVVVLATPWGSAKTVVESLGNLTGKVLVDATNPIGPDGQMAVGQATSAAEQIAGWAKGAAVVKAFNMTGAGNMADSHYAEGKPSMLIAGDGVTAKQKVASLAADLGFEVVDTGPLSTARYLEPLAMLWIGLAYRQGLGPNIAFRLLKR